MNTPSGRSGIAALCRVWEPWFWDSAALAYLMSGGIAYDGRLVLRPNLSINQLLGTLVLVGLLRSLLTRPRTRIRAGATVGIVLALSATMVIRAVGVVDVAYARFKVVSYLVLVLPVLLHFDVTIRNRSDINRFLKVAALMALALVGLSVQHMLTIQDGQRLAVLHGGPNVFARLVGFGLLSALVLSVVESSRWASLRHARWITLVAVIVCLLPAALALVLSGSKSVLLALCTSLIVGLFLLGRRRAAMVLVGVLVTASFLPVVTHRMVRERSKDGGLVRILRLPDVDDPLGSFGSRLRYARDTLQLVRDHAWLGVGTGDWGVRVGRSSVDKYPHNIGLEILSELGIVGLLVTVVPAFRFPRRWPRSRPDRRLATGLVVITLFWFLNVQVSGDLVDSRYLWISLALLELQLLGAARDEVWNTLQQPWGRETA